jgi:hypothetical protein
VPIELWHLCAVDRYGVGRRIRQFAARLEAGDETLPPVAVVAGVAGCEGGVTSACCV